MALRGKKKVLKNLVTARILGEAAADHASSEAAAKLARRAKINAPVAKINGGTLRASIKDEKIKTGVYEVSTNIEYAPYVEFGTSKMRAQPYMQPAIDETRKEFPDLIKGGLASRLRGAF